MQHVTFDVNENVLVVSVFDLQDVADQTVGTEGVGEVFNGLLVSLATGFAELLMEVVDDCGVGTRLFFDRGHR